MCYLVRTRTSCAFTRQGIGSLLLINKHCEKANGQIERSSFLKINYDPTTLHTDKVKEWTTKWISYKTNKQITQYAF